MRTLGAGARCTSAAAALFPYLLWHFGFGLPMVNRPAPRKWEPEPLRLLASHGVYWVIDQADRQEAETGRASRLYDLAKLVSGREAE